MHFDLISNIYFYIVMQVELLEWNFWHSADYKSGRAFRVGPGSGLGLSKYFVPAYKTFFIALGVTTFFFRDVDLLCSPQ